MRARRWARAAALGAAGLAALLATCVALLVALSQGWQRERLRGALEAYLARALDARVTLAALEGPLYPELGLRGLVVDAARGRRLEVEVARARLDATALLSERRLVVAWLRVEGARGDLERTFAGGPGGSGASPSAAEDGAGAAWPLRVELREIALERSALTLRWGALALRARGSLSARDLALPWEPASARALGARLDAALEIERLRDGRALGGGALRATLAGGRVTLAQAEVQGGFGRLALGGHAELPGAGDAVHLEIEFERLDLAALADRAELASALEGRALLDARIDPPAAELALTLGPSSVGSRAIRSASLRGTLGSASWRLESAAVDGEGLALSARGAGSWRAFEQLELESEIAGLASLAPWLGWPAPQLDGDLALRARLAGPFEAPAGSLALDAPNLRRAGRELGALRVRASSAGDGRVRIEAFELSGGSLPLRVEGEPELRVGGGGVTTDGLVLRSGAQSLAVSGGIFADGWRGASLRGRELDVAELARWTSAGVALAGLADLDLRLDGPLGEPRLEGSLAWQAPRIGALALDRVALDLRAGDRGLDARVRADAEGRELLAARVAMPRPLPDALGPALLRRPGLELDARGEGVDLAWFAPLVSRHAEALRGRADLDLRVRGGEVPEASGTLALHAAGLVLRPSGLDLSPLEAELRLGAAGPGEIGIESLQVTSAGGRLEASGRLSPDGFRGVEVELSDVDLTSLGLDAPLEGLARAQLRLEGPYARPELEGEGFWSEPRVAGVALDGVSVELAARGPELRGALRVEGAGRELLAATGRAPRPDAWPGLDALLRSPGAQLEVRGDDFDLALLDPFLPARTRELRGRLTLQASLRGAEPRPRLEGWLELADGSVSVPLLRQRFAPIAGRLRLSDREIAIERLEVGPAGARAALSGSVRLDEASAPRADLRLALTSFPVSRSPLFATDVTGRASLVGALDAPVVRGELALESASVSLREPRDPVQKEILVLAEESDGAAPREAAEGSDWLDRADVELEVSVPRRTWVRGRGAELEVHGEVALHKQPFEAPLYTGGLELVRGSYVFQRKRFEVRRGSARFVGSREPDPRIDIEAAHRVRDVTILLFLTGTASAPEVRIASEPPLSESDALAYLLLGRPAEELGAGSGPGLEAAAAQLAAGAALGEVSGLLRDALPLDTIDVKIAEDGNGGEVRVGKYVTDRVFVRYGQAFGAEPEEEVEVELRLTPNWSLQSEITSDENAGADLIFQWEY